MAKKAKFVQQANRDKETDRRVEIETTIDAPIVSDENKYLDELYAFIKDKTEDCLHRDHVFDRIHVGMIMEFGTRKANGKSLVLSDGNKEMLFLNYSRLKTAGKI